MHSLYGLGSTQYAALQCAGAAELPGVPRFPTFRRMVRDTLSLPDNADLWLHVDSLSLPLVPDTRGDLSKFSQSVIQN